MPTPYGSRGGMAFSAEELRVLRRALALALHPRPASAEDVQDCLRLAEAVDEAVREGGPAASLPAGRPGPLPRRAPRHRRRLPGAPRGAPWPPATTRVPDDLAALRALRGNPRRAPPCWTAASASPSRTYAPVSRAPAVGRRVPRRPAPACRPCPGGRRPPGGAAGRPKRREPNGPPRSPRPPPERRSRSRRGPRARARAHARRGLPARAQAAPPRRRAGAARRRLRPARGPPASAA